MPKFLCINAEGCVLGNQSNPADPRNQNALDVGGATLENYISIISVILWPASERLSLLMAGDAYHSTKKKLKEQKESGQLAATYSPQQSITSRCY